ncbi:MAG: hypothetical protein CFE45_21305 [Burkholderiales bacterium PBB5]|nr:MAG: hypothetical protein CFE45_21305 [Burkholderiales bacterium PBB5]
MPAQPDNTERRTLLQRSAQLAMAGSAVATGAAMAQGQAAPPVANGQAGDFDFLTGRWTIKNRKLKPDGSWDVFDGEATVHGLLQGVASVEELRIPARNFSGMGLRLLDRERRLWADHWVNSRSGGLTPPPSWGSFVNGVGTWDSEDMDGTQPITVRGVWDQITPTSCRWYQALSRDGGRQWAEQWVMHWQRA